MNSKLIVRHFWSLPNDKQEERVFGSLRVPHKIGSAFNSERQHIKIRGLPFYYYIFRQELTAFS